MIRSSSMYSLPGNVSFFNEQFLQPNNQFAGMLAGLNTYPGNLLMWWVDGIIINVYMCKNDGGKTITKQAVRLSLGQSVWEGQHPSCGL